MLKKTKPGRLALLLAAGWVVAAGANNIQVSNLALLDQDVPARQLSLVFDLSWDNSWRNELNHDAAWIFVKFRAPGSNHWQHAILSSDPADHVPVLGSAITTVGDGMGVFVSSAGLQTGTVVYERLRVRWDYGANGYAFALGEPIDVSVQAIEMVYVAEGAFSVGSGGTENGSFTDGSWSSGATIPFAISSENALPVNNVSGALWGTGSDGNNTVGPVGELPAAFPKGYAAFYGMKYPITQGQYADFLNLLNQTQAGNLYSAVNYDQERYIIRGAWPAFSASEAPDRACNWLAWPRGAAYVHWAGLRPMTELEFEKACRGPATPVPLEYAWGSNTGLSAMRNHFAGGPADGSGLELASNTTDGNTLGGNCNYGNLLPAGNIGPVRVGLFAATGTALGTPNRVAAGASYWGMLDLSGNVRDCTVSVGHTTGRLFTGSHGDGRLSSAGYATRSDWPGYSSAAQGVTGTEGAGLRGGSYPDGVDYLRVSHRFHAVWMHPLLISRKGMRGVRTAP